MRLDGNSWPRSSHEQEADRARRRQRQPGEQSPVHVLSYRTRRAAAAAITAKV